MTAKRDPEDVAVSTAVEEPSISLSHFMQTIYAYRYVILVSMLAILTGYAIVAVALYVTAPSSHVTRQPFRLEFAKADKGEYPNGSPFSVTDIVCGPVLQRVYKADQLEQFLPYSEFSTSLYIAQSNPAYDALAAEYQARLSDPRLTAIDRDRLQAEFELKSASVAKNQYAIVWVRHNPNVPETIVRKALVDVLNTWSDYAVNEQHVISYQTNVLSADILKPVVADENDYIVALLVLRGKVRRFLDNVRELEQIPGSTLARTQDHTSLAEVRIRLDEIIRYRIEPLINVARSNGLMTASSVQFAEQQLGFDQRSLKALQDAADAIRQTLNAYESTRADRTPNMAATTTQGIVTPGKEGESIVLNESFLDRVVSMATRSADLDYRQRLAAQYQAAMVAQIPESEAVAYDTQLLASLRGPAGSAVHITPVALQAQINDTRSEVAALISHATEIYREVSRNLSPTSQMLSVTAPPITRIERGRSLDKLALYAIPVLLIGFAVVLISVLIHNRIRQERAEEGILAAPAEVSA